MDESGGKPVKPLAILLVEDSPSDVKLMREALQEAGVNIAIDVARDGVECMDHLRAAEQRHSPRPDLVLLDWHLPRKDGRQVLSEIKSSDGLKMIPVIIMTSSKAEEDITEAYQLNANSLINKPSDLDQYITTVRAIEAFWFFTATPPPNLDRAPTSSKGAANRTHAG
jgi:CheY-like chemotaxis protein